MERATWLPPSSSPATIRPGFTTTGSAGAHLPESPIDHILWILLYPSQKLFQLPGVLDRGLLGIPLEGTYEDHDIKPSVGQVGNGP